MAPYSTDTLEQKNAYIVENFCFPASILLKKNTNDICT